MAHADKHTRHVIISVKTNLQSTPHSPEEREESPPVEYPTHFPGFFVLPKSDLNLFYYCSE